jgi:hypothetical protein
LSERANVEKYISEELVELKAAHATPRLSSIQLEYEELSDMDLTPQEACVIVQVGRPPPLPKPPIAAPPLPPYCYFASGFLHLLPPLPLALVFEV